MAYFGILYQKFYLLALCFFVSVWTVEGLVCFIKYLPDPSEGGRLRWSVPLSQKGQCASVFASPIGRHIRYPGNSCQSGCCHHVKSWFADDISSFLDIAQDIANLTVSTPYTAFKTISTSSVKDVSKVTNISPESSTAGSSQGVTTHTDTDLSSSNDSIYPTTHEESTRVGALIGTNIQLSITTAQTTREERTATNTATTQSPGGESTIRTQSSGHLSTEKAPNSSIVSATVNDSGVLSYVAPETNLTASNEESGHAFRGCFIDGLPFILPHNWITHSLMTRELCFGHCLSKQMKYAGLHGDSCTCGMPGDDYAIKGQAEDDKCFYRCNGNYEQYCGGSYWPDLFGLILYTSVFELTIECPTPSASWIYFNGSCYQRTAFGKTWSDAKEECSKVPDTTKAHLVVVNSNVENDFVRGFGFPDYIWLGCTDEGHEGSWDCLDPSGNTYDYSSNTGVGFWAWGVGEPRADPVLIWFYENCMVISPVVKTWADVDCNWGPGIHGICEVEVSDSCCPEE